MLIVVISVLLVGAVTVALLKKKSPPMPANSVQNHNTATTSVNATFDTNDYLDEALQDLNQVE